jgi:minor extracellular protease Epr
VIAVAAVDARGRPYASNNRGSYIEIAAPGVDIWAAHVSGGEAFWTGTSFAVPFVTAAIAREVSRGTVRNINDARHFLAASARDLGARGRDPVYGHGLLQARSCG